MLRRIILLCILIYFLFASLTDITTLGLSHDEGQRGLESLEILEFKHFPLMREFYVGAVVSYLQVPFFLIFGSTVFAIRFAQVVFSLGSIVCVYYVCKRWFNNYIGIISALLLSINPVFILATRLGAVREEILQIFLFWLGLALIQFYIDKKKSKYLYAGFFIFGLALSAKIMFLGYMVGMVITILLFGKRAFNVIKNRVFNKKYNFLVSVAMFLMGSFFILAYNIISRGETITKLWSSLVIKGAGAEFGAKFGTNNLDFIHNVSQRFLDFKSLLTESIFLEGNNSINLVLFFASLVVIIGYLFFSKKQLVSKNKILFLISTYSFLLLATSFTPREYDHANIIILFPIIQIIIAVSLYLALSIFKKNIIYIVVATLLILVPPVYMGINLYHNYLGKLQITGGEYESSIAVYALVNYLKENNIKKNIFSVGEWGPIGNVNFLLKRRVVLPLPYFRHWQEDSGLKFKTFLEQYKEAYFIRIIGCDSQNGNRDFESLKEAALRNKKIISEVRLFRNRIGQASYALYKLE